MERKKRVLVVDDEPNIRDSLQVILNYNGYDVATAATGEIGLELLRESRFDLLILDVKIPDMDGFQILSRVRTEHPDLKIVIITGFGTLDVARKALSLGAIHYYDKPIDIECFIRDIQKAVPVD